MQLAKSNKKVYIHLGYGKTATTWLQDIFFPALAREENITFLGKTSANYPEWLLNLHYLDDICFYNRCDHIKDELQSVIAKSKYDKVLISSEAFTNSYSIYNQANRLRKVLPEANIILVVRSPIDLVIDKYKYMVYDSNYLEKFENSFTEDRRIYVPYKNPPTFLSDFFYDEVEQFLKTLFQTLNVLQYELFRDDKRIFLEKMCELLDVGFVDTSIHYDEYVNKNISDDDLEKQRVLNMIAFLKENFAIDLNDYIDTSRLYKNITFSVDKRKLEKLKSIFRGTSRYYEF